MNPTIRAPEGLQKLVCVELQELALALDRSDSGQDPLSPETYRRISRYTERLMRPLTATPVLRQLAQSSPALRDLLWNLMFEDAYLRDSVLLLCDTRQLFSKKAP